MHATTKPLAAAAAMSAGVVLSFVVGESGSAALSAGWRTASRARACQVQGHERFKRHARRHGGQDAAPICCCVSQGPHRRLQVGHHHRPTKHPRGEGHHRREGGAVTQVEVPGGPGESRAGWWVRRRTLSGHGASKQGDSAPTSHPAEPASALCPRAPPRRRERQLRCCWPAPPGVATAAARPAGCGVHRRRTT